MTRGHDDDDDEELSAFSCRSVEWLLTNLFNCFQWRHLIKLTVVTMFAVEFHIKPRYNDRNCK